MANSKTTHDETGVQRLDSWKEIATYLGRDVTTVMRWERERALPVHRVPGHAKRQTVYAYTQEIDEWLLGKGNRGSSLGVGELGKGFRDSGLGVGEEKTGVRSDLRSPMAPMNRDQRSESQKLEVRSYDRSEADYRTPEIGESEAGSLGQATGDKESGARVSREGTRLAEKEVLSPWMAALVPHGRRQFFTYLLTAGCVAVAAVAVYSLTRPSAMPKVLGYHQITNDGRLREGQIVTDGVSVYFSELTPSGWTIAEVPATGGEVKPLSTFFDYPSIQDLSRSRSEILILDPVRVPSRPSLWAMPLSGGPPRRVGSILADAAAWTPGGNSIVYAAGNELYLCNLDGSQPRKFASLPAQVIQIRMSPYGDNLRLTMGNLGSEARGIWEVRADGSDAHPLLPGWRATHVQADGRWTQDGKYFLFSSAGGYDADLWALSEKGGILGRAFSPPTRLTSGALSVIGWVPSPSGNRAFALEQGFRAQVLRYARGQNRPAPYLPGVSADYLDFNGNGEWVTYVDLPDLTLWKSRWDGTQAVQLTFPRLNVELPRWSPDGKWIAFMGTKPGDEIWKVYVIPAEGGEPQVAMPSASAQGAPTWSQDGKRIAFGNLQEGPGAFPSSTAIHIVDLTSHSATILPGSNGLYTARWSPDGRHIAALTTDGKTLKIFDFRTSQWQEVASAGSISDLNWSRKSDAVYFVDVLPTSGPAIYKVRLQDRKLEKITTMQGSTPIRSAWLGVAPDDSLLISNSVGTSEIYALDLDLP